jgi:hypothetical protein
MYNANRRLLEHCSHDVKLYILTTILHGEGRERLFIFRRIKPNAISLHLRQIDIGVLHFGVGCLSSAFKPQDSLSETF